MQNRMSVFICHKSEFAYIRYNALYCFVLFVFQLVGQAANRVVFMPVLSALCKTWNGMDWNGMEWNEME